MTEAGEPTGLVQEFIQAIKDGAERIKALLQWRNTSWISTLIIESGRRSLPQKRPLSSESIIISAYPFTLKVSLIPGTKKSRPTP